MFVRSFAVLVAVGLSSPIFAADQMQTLQMQTLNKQQSIESIDKPKEYSTSPVNERELSTRGPIYGIQLMPPEEQQVYRTKLRNLETRDEQEQFLREHHKLMNERAKARGVTLRNVPPKHAGKTVAAENKQPTQVNIMGPLGW